MKRVRVGTIYRFNPVGWDVFRPANKGLEPNEPVKVVSLPGCPRPGTMGHCHVERISPIDGQWTFAGLVLLASLQPWKEHEERDNR